MNVLITLTTAGVDSGPFNLYSDVDGYVAAFCSPVDRLTLLAGLSCNSVPDGTTIIKVVSTGENCNNSIYMPVSLVTTTTTTSTTTSTSTTTTTTTTELPVNHYLVQICSTENYHTIDSTEVFAENDVIQFQIGIPGTGTIYCGVVSDTAFHIPDSSLYSPTVYQDCPTCVLAIPPL